MMIKRHTFGQTTLKMTWLTLGDDLTAAPRLGWAPEEKGGSHRTREDSGLVSIHDDVSAGR